MAKKFNVGNTAKELESVAAKNAEQKKAIPVSYVEDSDLLDFPDNDEDISITSDLEISIKRNGFTLPIDVTDFEMPPGKFMICSGHRRRAAGRKTGYTSFPCYIRHFGNKADMLRFIQYANANRDSSQDRLLIPKRIRKANKLYETYPDTDGLTNRQALARDFGLSEQQIDRYLGLCKCIDPIWDLLSNPDNDLSISAFDIWSSHAPKEQEEMFELLQRLLEDGVKMTRPRIEGIVKLYRDGKSVDEMKNELTADENAPGGFDDTAAEPEDDETDNENDDIFNEETEKSVLRDSGLPLAAVGSINAESKSRSGEPKPRNRNNEINKEWDSDIRFGGEGVKERPNYDPEYYAVPKPKTDNNDDAADSDEFDDDTTDIDDSDFDETGESEETGESDSLRMDKIEIAFEETTKFLNELFGDCQSESEARVLMQGGDNLIFLLVQQMKALADKEDLQDELDAIKKTAAEYFEV